MHSCVSAWKFAQARVGPESSSIIHMFRDQAGGLKAGAVFLILEITFCPPFILTYIFYTFKLLFQLRARTNSNLQGDNFSLVSHQSSLLAKGTNSTLFPTYPWPTIHSQICFPAALPFGCRVLLPLAHVIVKPLRRSIVKHTCPTTSHTYSKPLMNWLNLDCLLIVVIVHAKHNIFYQ